MRATPLSNPKIGAANAKNASAVTLRECIRVEYTGGTRDVRENCMVIASSRYRFLLSLPERVVRSAAALAGGILREVNAVALPARVRRTVLYRLMVEVALRFLIEQVGQGRAVYGDSNELARNFVLKRGASHGIEIIGLLTIRVSPIWVLAALADVTGAGHELIREISQALKDEGLLNPDHQFETADQLLEGLEKTSIQLAEALNLPPFDAASLRREWNKLKENAALMNPEAPSLERLQTLWRRLTDSAAAQDRSLFAICSSLAVSAVSDVPAGLQWLSRAALVSTRRTGEVLGEALLLHYVRAAEDMNTVGFVAYWQRQFQPYLRGAAEQFERTRPSSTEKFLGRGEK